jgi:cold shock protein
VFFEWSIFGQAKPEELLLSGRLRSYCYLFNPHKIFVSNIATLSKIETMSESFSKKELRSKKAKAKQDKAQKMQDRKANNNKGKSLEDMMAYIDENGNLSPVPPRRTFAESNSLEDIGTPSNSQEEVGQTGVISFFNSSKGFGFIAEDNSRESVFFHINQLTQPVKEKDRVTFLKEKTSRGFNAVSIKKI